ncbi:MAG: diguanylate cyclase [Alishewanella agri]|nr:diguanylate cyclase [Alishewanella agri]
MIPTDNNKTDLRAAFSLVRQRFEQSLPARASAMQALLQADETSAQALNQLISEAHKLAGACGTFGFALLGSQAKMLEQLARTIQEKPASEQRYALLSLQSAVQDFLQSVQEALRNSSDASTVALLQPRPENSIWLLLETPALIAELEAQLQAFGHQVRIFNSYDSCLEALSQEAPAVLFTAIKLANGQSLFKQKLLLDRLNQQQSRLMLYSEQDIFDLRVKAAQLRAEAFFVSPVDVPNMIATISELLEQTFGQYGRVFIVDDDKLLAEHYALVLKAAGIETRILQQVTQLVHEVLSFQPDLVLMDIYMPDYSGTELAGVLRQYQSLKRLPIVYLSSEANKLLQMKAMAQGADDFLTKPISDNELVQAVKARLRRSQQIRLLIEKDGLTSLIKHSAIKEAAALELERATRFDKPLSIVMLDIDYFKSVNDQYGHATGDIVITALATLLRKRIRKTDKAGRYGGEEFMLVLPDCNSLQARQLTENILQSFRQLQFSAGNSAFSCSFSAGVASTSDSSYAHADELIAAADTALYQAKQAGRNRVY